MSTHVRRLVGVTALVALTSTVGIPGASASSYGSHRHEAMQRSQAFTGAGQVRAAVDPAQEPTTTPTITSPSADAVVGGDLSVTASSTASTVQFEVDGAALGQPVTVTSGSASQSWSTWGLANGSHTITAADCESGACGTSTSVAVTVTNSAAAITAPIAGAVLSGEVPFNASSQAPQVQFQIDETALGAPVATASGVATTTLSTYGLANGAHTLHASNCDGAGVCAPPTDLQVSVDNSAPAITAPTSGQTVGAMTTLAADAPGGGVAFFVDGVNTGFDASAPYSLALNASELADGSHSVYAVSCSVDGSACDGPHSPEISFTVVSAHPVVLSAVSPISPNGDKRFDTSRIVLRLPDTETVVYRIKAPDGSTFRGPVSLGNLKKGDHALVWDGKNNKHQYATSGLYTVAFSTTATISGATVHGAANKGIRVDRTAPTFTHITGANGRFFPIVDGYQDSFTPGVQVSEASSLLLNIYNSKGVLQRSLTHDAPSSAHAYQIAWNGHTTGGRQVPAGTYRFAWTATDRLGNVRTIGRYAVTVSLAKLVSKTVTLVRNADASRDFGGSNTNCAGIAAKHSAYAHGLWLLNVCDPSVYGNQVTAAEYVWTLPAASRYTSLRFDVNGYSHHPTSDVVGVSYDYKTGDYDALIAFKSTGAKAWHTVSHPTVSAHLSGRTVKTDVAVLNNPQHESDFDTNQVRLVVGYQVLQ